MKWSGVRNGEINRCVVAGQGKEMTWVRVEME